ncbi:MAG: hypothetical protein AB7V04_00095 [Desulfomonilaceae bacterium]
MTNQSKSDHILIREGSIIVRLLQSESEEPTLEFYDFKTGVRLKKIYPPLKPVELEKGCRITLEAACAIIKNLCFSDDPETSESGKVVTILEARQRKLDSVVADSILDQARIIANILRDYVELADHCNKEERFWLSQQILTTVRKISGRELSEIQEIVEWFNNIQPRK